MFDVVQGLWIGSRLGPFGELTIQSFLKQGHPFHLYCYDVPDDLPPDATLKDAAEILPRSEVFTYQTGHGKGSVSAFSNLFRYQLLYDRGGWWVDMDVCCLRPFALDSELVLAVEHHRKGWQVASAILRFPPGHPCMKECLEEARRAKDDPMLTWGRIGPELVARLAAKHGLHRFAESAQRFMPVPPWGWLLLLGSGLEARICRSFLTPETLGVHLWHEMYRRELKTRRLEIPDDCVLAELLREHGLWPRAFPEPAGPEETSGSE